MPRGMLRGTRCALVAGLVGLSLAPAAVAHIPVEESTPYDSPGLRRLLTASGGETMRAAAADPVLKATPRASCGAGSLPETDIQGRVPEEGSDDGFRCNLSLLGREGAAGGFKVHRFVDRAGHECAYYDTTLLFPANVQSLSDQPTGVAVLDMTDPARPVRTATLATPAMQSPHESMVLNERRGLLAAVMGNPAFAPGVVDIYDVGEDCRQPVLQSSLPVGIFGHESGFAPDGNTFYATSLATGTVTGIDITDPKLPKPVWVGQYPSHGMTVSDDGNRGYLAALGGLIIVDLSEVQARRPNPQVREISRLTWDTMTIPQVALPVTIGGKPFLVEVDEFSGTETSMGPAVNGSKVGAARIIDISNEAAPRVVSDIRLAVHQPENRAAIASDPGTSSPAQGYAGHYCSVPSRVEPGIVACSFIASGLRVFDIRDPAAPKEIAYYVAPKGRSSTAGAPSNYAMSSPVFVPERGEIWYSDGNTGFYSLRVAKGVWPFSADTVCRDRVAPGTRLSRSGVRLSSARTPLTVRGTARDSGSCATGVARVQVSLARVRGRTGVNCRFLTRPDKYVLTRAGNCRKPVLFTARGTRSWSFRFTAKLKPGRYRVQVRSTDSAGNKERPRNLSFRVR